MKRALSHDEVRQIMAKVKLQEVAFCHKCHGNFPISECTSKQLPDGRFRFTCDECTNQSNQIMDRN